MNGWYQSAHLHFFISTLCYNDLLQLLLYVRRQLWYGSLTIWLAISAKSTFCSIGASHPSLSAKRKERPSQKPSWLILLLTDASLLMTIAIALLREPLRAVGAGEGLRVVVSAHVVLHIRHLREHFQANFALTALILTTGLFVDFHSRAPQFFLANLDGLLAAGRHSLGRWEVRGDR